MSIRKRLREFKIGMGPTVKEIRFMVSRIRESPLSIVGVGILLFFVAIALLAPVLAPPYPEWSIVPTGDPFRVPRDSYMQPPSPPDERHIFGTTPSSYDLYYGVIWGTITAFRIGFWVVAAALAIGLAIGTIAGYYGGIIDELMMRFTDIVIAFPGLILAMAFVVAFGRSLDNVLLALVLVGWPGYTRVIRGEILRVREEDYIEAAKAAGCSDFRIIFRHMLPNAIYSILIMASMDIGSIVLSAAALSFLGLGTTGYADWGAMINLAQAFMTDPDTMRRYWHIFVIPGLFIFTFVLGWNLLGDAFRDIMDPTIRRR